MKLSLNFFFFCVTILHCFLSFNCVSFLSCKSIIMVKCLTEVTQSTIICGCRTPFWSQTSVESVLPITLELLEQLSFTEEIINTFSNEIPIMIRYDHQWQRIMSLWFQIPSSMGYQCAEVLFSFCKHICVILASVNHTVKLSTRGFFLQNKN